MPSTPNGKRSGNGTQDHDQNTRPASHKGQGRRSAGKAGNPSKDAPKTGAAQHKKDGTDG